MLNSDGMMLQQDFRTLLMACEMVTQFRKQVAEKGRENLDRTLGIIPADEWCVVWIRNFWEAYYEIKTKLDRLPVESVKELSEFHGKPWLLLVRRTLHALADPFNQTHPWSCEFENDGLAMHESNAMIQACLDADLSTWPKLLGELKEIEIDASTLPVAESSQDHVASTPFLRDAPS